MRLWDRKLSNEVTLPGIYESLDINRWKKKNLSSVREKMPVLELMSNQGKLQIQPQQYRPITSSIARNIPGSLSTTEHEKHHINET